MTILPLHSWDVSSKEAVVLQRELAGQIRLTKLDRPLETVAGCDISYNKRSPELFAAIVVVRVPELDIIEIVTVKKTVTFPYVPGLLSFRECPPLLEAFARLTSRPSAVMLDGQGIAHPRRFGLACHMGLWLDLPTLGCAKSRFVGEYEPPGDQAGEASPLRDEKGERIGVVMRTRQRTNPVFVSPGHRIEFRGAVKIVQATLSGYRVPVPTRLAHIAANESRATGKTTHNV